MKIPYFCCIGAELKRYAKDFDFMNQVYLYKVPTDDSIEEVLDEDYFKAISDSVLQDDLVYIYEASAETLHSCRFDKQNGHITAIPLASDETLTGAVTTIIHDNLTKNRAVISNNDGKVAVSEVTSTELGYLSGATSNIQTQLNNKASKDLDNLTSKGANIGNWSTNVTNCITQIPQDIKLELAADGTLTLKSGSKVYVPNGSGTFDTVTTTADVSVTRTDTNKCMVYYTPASNILSVLPLILCFSGSTAPSGYQFMYWYDTTENKCKFTNDSGTTWFDGRTLPLAIVSTDGSKISAIDRIFNGFGYVGRSIFSLPGVRVLRPAGRNDNGTLKNNIGSIGTVAVRTFDTTDNFDKAVVGWWDSFTRYDYNNWTYNEIENINYVSGTIWNYAVIGTIKLTNGVISEFNIKTPFHAVDYNDSGYIANCAMPSGKYVDLTLPSSSGTVTAPADGCFTVTKGATAAGQAFTFSNETNGLRSGVQSGGAINVRCFIPVSKGDVVSINYSVDGSTSTFRFVYANGAK